MNEWIVSLGIGIITFISIFVTVRVQTNQNQKDIEELKENQKTHKKTDEDLHSKMFDKLDAITKEVAEHKIKLSSAPSMKDVDDKFVSKEMFKQMEKHIDQQFETMGKSLENTLLRVLNNQEQMMNEFKEKK